MLFNAIFNIFSYMVAVSIIGGGNRSTWEKKHRPAASNRQTLSHKKMYRVHLARNDFEFPILVVIGTDCIRSCKSHAITTTTAPSDMNIVYICISIICVNIESVANINTRKQILLTSTISHFIYCME